MKFIGLILIGCLTLSQKYCKPIEWYWNIMSGQLWTLTCPIHISAFQIHSYREIPVASERSLCCYASETANNVCLYPYPTVQYCAIPVHAQKSNLCSNWNVVTMTSNIQRFILFIRFGCKFDFCLCTLSQWEHIIFYWVSVKSFIDIDIKIWWFTIIWFLIPALRYFRN